MRLGAGLSPGRLVHACRDVLWDAQQTLLFDQLVLMLAVLSPAAEAPSPKTVGLASMLDT